jgi:hypothetical protein
MLVQSYKYSCVPLEHNVYAIRGTTMCVEGDFRGPFLKNNSYNKLQCIPSLHPSQNTGAHEGGSDHLHLDYEYGAH